MTTPLRVLFLGYGSITQDVLRFLQPERTAGAIEVAGAVVRSETNRDAEIPLFTAERLDSQLPGVDLVVECAGVDAATTLGVRSVRSGCPLVLTSVGALAHRETAQALLAGPGELIVTNGAIGGFDVLEATAFAAGFTSVMLETSKHAPSLVQPWMDDAERLRLEQTPAGQSLTVFEGNPRAAIEKFPANVNIAVALSWITRDRDTATLDALDAAFERTVVKLIGTGSPGPNTHRITTRSDAGTLEFNIASAPSATNPKTSGLTAMSVARNVREFADRAAKA